MKGRPAVAVLAAPFDVGEIGAVAVGEKTGAAVGKGIGDRRRAGGRVVVELGARAVDIAGMEKAQETIVGAVERAADQGGDVGRAQEAIARQLADDDDIVVGETKGRRFRRTAEARAANAESQQIAISMRPL